MERVKGAERGMVMGRVRREGMEARGMGWVDGVMLEEACDEVIKRGKKWTPGSTNNRNKMAGGVG